MTSVGRRVRLAATAAIVLLLVGGSLVGSDDWFPLGPFRMYATSGRTTGAVRTAVLVAVDESGDEVPLVAEELGLRRAELEGQLRRFRDDPDLLAALAAHVEDARGVRLVAIRLEEEVRPVVDRRPTGEVDRRVVVSWER